jgi:hypothetical protein
MTGGIIQLVAYGVEDLFLTRDPQITFFKVIYRRHTNFAREEIPLQFIQTPNFGKRASCIISTEADLLNRMALKITLPALQNQVSSNTVTTSNSFEYTGGTSTDNTAIKYAWIRRIGYAMIKSVEIEINGVVIDTHYGEWLHIWSTLTTRNINDSGLNKLIGNVPELTDFTTSKDEYILYVPLQFWFCRTPGLSLPLICLQYSDIKINLELHDLESCLLTSPTHYIKCFGDIVNFAPYEFIYQQGDDGITRYGIFSYYDILNKRLYYTSVDPNNKFIGVPIASTINPMTVDNTTKIAILKTQKSQSYAIHGVSTSFSVLPELAVTTISVHKRSLLTIVLQDCVLLTDYVYIDDDERMKFAHTKHDYLIELLNYTPDVAVKSTNPSLKLNIDQPCKLSVWLCQLDYISNFNDRFNYTDSHVIKRPYDTNHTDPTKIKQYSLTDVGEPIGNSLINEEAIRLNSQIRLSKRLNAYYEYVQPINHSNNSLPKGCGMYSYALMPTDTAPSGTTNMSQIDLIELLIKMNYRVNINQSAKFRSYSLVYNIWRVDNGLSSPIFVR